MIFGMSVQDIIKRNCIDFGEYRIICIGNMTLDLTRFWKNKTNHLVLTVEPRVFNGFE